MSVNSGAGVPLNISGQGNKDSSLKSPLFSAEASSSHSTDSDSRLQCVADCRAIMRKHRYTAIFGGTAFFIGILLCLLLQPDPRILDIVRADAIDVAEWAGSFSSYGLDLAANVCPEQGKALDVTYNSTSNSFQVDCLRPRLSRRAFVTLGVTLTALCLMISGQPPDICMLGATLVLLLWPWADSPGKGIISESEAWQGFSNEGVLTVGALFVVAKAVDATGIVNQAMKVVLGKPKTLFLAQLRLLIPVAIGSAFMNNTPIVAMLIPVVESWAPMIGHHSSKFLMPLSFASMLGGMCSMMGTSTNLVVAGLLRRKDPGMKPFGLFDIVPVGGPCALAGIIYMAIFSKCLLPGRRKETNVSATGMTVSEGKQESTLRSYLVHFIFDSRSQHISCTAKELGLDSLNLQKNGIVLENIFSNFASDMEGARKNISSDILNHDHEILDGKDPDGIRTKQENAPIHSNWDGVEILAGGMICIRCYAEKLGALRRDLSGYGMRLISEMPTVRKGIIQGRRRSRRHLAEVVVGRKSPVIGMPCGTLTDIGEIGEVLLSRYGAALVSVRKEHGYAKKRRPHPRSRENEEAFLSANSESEPGRILVSGDVLLVEVFATSVDLMLNDFILVTDVPGSKPPRSGKYMDKVRKGVAGLTVITMVVLSATNVMSLLVASLLASTVLLAFKTITLKSAFSSINGRTLLAIVTTFGVGTAFETTGLAHWIARGLIGIFGDLGPFGVVLSVAIVTSIIGCAISNNAVVILMYPICKTLAERTDGVSLRQLLVVLLVGASSSFLTPMSYQTNLMVFSPGKYRFSDYARFGLGLQLLMVSISIAMSFVASDFYKD